jgi:small subunit ribosomal protein S12
MKIGITTPRKPNSAKRKFARVRVMASKKLISAHPPGIGPIYIQEYSLVLVEGGSPPDTPGTNYSLIRGVYDFCISEEYGRRRRRSKFGAKTPSILFNAIKSLKDSVEIPKNITIRKDDGERSESF